MDDAPAVTVDPNQYQLLVCPMCGDTFIATRAEAAGRADRCATCAGRRRRRRAS